MRISIETIERAKKLYPDMRRHIESAIRKLNLGEYTKLSTEERHALALLYFLQSPWAYRIDIAKKGHIGNPLRDPYADVPGVDTPDSLANYYWARSYVIRHQHKPLTMFLKQEKERTEKVYKPVPIGKSTKQGIELEEVARFIVYADKLVSDAKKAYEQLGQLIETNNYSRLADYAYYLARLVPRLEEAKEKAKKLYIELAVNAPEAKYRIDNRIIFLKPELHRLERDLDSLFYKLYDMLRWLAEESLNAAKKLAEKYEGMKRGLRYRQLYEELEKLYHEARTPEEYAHVVKKLAEFMELETGAETINEKALMNRAEAKTLAKKMKELAKRLEKIETRLSKREEKEKASRMIASLRAYAKHLEEKAHTEPDYYIVSKLFKNVLKASRELVEKAEKLLEQLSRTAVHKKGTQPPPTTKPRWEAEVLRLADYLWENIPRKERKKWSYIQVLQLARLIITNAKRTGIDYKGIDWAHEIDWHQGYAAAKQKVLQLLGTRRTLSEKELEEQQQYIEQQMISWKPAWLEEKPEEWEIRAWEAAAIPS